VVKAPNVIAIKPKMHVIAKFLFISNCEKKLTQSIFF